MADDPRDAQIEDLRRRLSEAEQTIQALLSGQLDSVAPQGANSPVLLAAAQDELRRSRQRFLAIFESSADGMMLFDDDGRYVEANPAACELLGTTREQLLQKTAGAFMVQRQIGARNVQAVVQTGRLAGEVEIITGDGRKRLVEYRARSSILPGLHLSIFRDVTEARAAHAAQARLAAIVESSGVAILGLNHGGTIEDWNRAAEQMYGYAASEIIGRSPALLQPVGRETEWEQLRARVASGESVSELETVRRRKDGVEIDVSVTISPIRNASGAIVGASKVARDISERKRAEQRFKDLLESAPDGMLMVDCAGKIALVNRQAERLFGYHRGEMIGAPVDVLVPEELRARHAAHWRSFFEAPRARLKVTDIDLKARRKDGTDFDVEITLSPVSGAEGNQNVIAAVRDVSERNRMRDQLFLADRMASIGTLAAGVAHEINNPLSAVMTNLDLAVQRVEGLARRVDELGELQDELRDARDAAQRVRQIVRDLKIFARGEDEALGPVDVRRVMDSTLRIAQNEIRHRARIVEDYRSVPPVQANESRLGQVFLNILVNAAQAIPEGRVEAHEIRVRTWVDAEGRVVIAVTDTGAGMSPEVQKSLFRPFFTTKPIGTGTGLGLSICHRLVTGFGGQISVESKVGQGTTFFVALPPATGSAVQSEQQAVVPGASRRGRVLVVDDEQIIGRSVRRALSQEHDVLALSSAREALHQIAQGDRFDVILCDLMMPQMTGMELYAELLRVEPDQAARTIFLSGGAFTPSARSFVDQTSNLVIDKPFDSRHLRALINDRIR